MSLGGQIDVILAYIAANFPTVVYGPDGDVVLYIDGTGAESLLWNTTQQFAGSDVLTWWQGLSTAQKTTAITAVRSGAKLARFKKHPLYALLKATRRPTHTTHDTHNTLTPVRRRNARTVLVAALTNTIIRDYCSY